MTARRTDCGAGALILGTVRLSEGSRKPIFFDRRASMGKLATVTSKATNNLDLEENLTYYYLITRINNINKLDVKLTGNDLKNLGENVNKIRRTQTCGPMSELRKFSLS